MAVCFQAAAHHRVTELDGFVWGSKREEMGVKDRAGRIWEGNELISQELIESWISLSVNWQ